MHELLGLEAYRREMNGRSDACLLCDYAHLEVEKQERIVYQNRNFICVVPWWAVVGFVSLITIAVTDVKLSGPLKRWSCQNLI